MNVQDRIEQDIRDSIMLSDGTPEDRLEQMAVSEALTRLDRSLTQKSGEDGILQPEQINDAVMVHVRLYEESIQQMTNSVEVERIQRIVARLKEFLVSE